MSYRRFRVDVSVVEDENGPYVAEWENELGQFAIDAIDDRMKSWWAWQIYDCGPYDPEYDDKKEEDEDDEEG